MGVALVTYLEGGGAVGRSRYDSAIAAEAVLRDAVSAVGGSSADALELLLGLAVDGHGRPLKDRRRLAADHLDVLPDTFRRHREGELLWDIAFAIYARHEAPMP
jgi:hypothetical protein